MIAERNPLRLSGMCKFTEKFRFRFSKGEMTEHANLSGLQFGMIDIPFDQHSKKSNLISKQKRLTCIDDLSTLENNWENFFV